MKKYLQSPSAFILSLIVVVILEAQPTKTLAQEKKLVSKSIIIKNGDTIINGQNLKGVSRSERKKLMKELEEIRLGPLNHELPHPPEPPAESQVIIRKKKDGEPEQIIVKKLNAPKVMILKDGDISSSGIHKEVDSIFIRLDSSQFKNQFLMIDGLDSNLKVLSDLKVLNDGATFEMFSNTPDGAKAIRMPMMKNMRFNSEYGNEKNSQIFSYSNIDKDGISNRLDIRLTEAAKESVVKITGSEKANTGLIVDDLNIFPSFSTGKINVVFSLKSKGALEVKILDNNFQSVFSDKQPNFNESYYKSFALPKNGIYYLVLNQAGNWWVKKMIKE